MEMVDAARRVEKDDVVTVSVNSLIPEVSKDYVPLSFHADLKTIIESRRFHPTYIVGESGNGKTFCVNQVCAESKRELMRVNITAQTDEDDLLGGFRLHEGATVWHDGPVVEAMKRGAVLLLDEIDLASAKIMCMQPVLEGNGVFLKKINTQVNPAPGFTIVATANTKGKGSDSGKYMFTNTQNEALLERFPVTWEQSYPTKAEETKILKKLFKNNDMVNPETDAWVKHLTDFAYQTRKLVMDGMQTDQITTRRLVHIVNSFMIFKDQDKAVKLCTSRFEAEVSEAFWTCYEAVRPKVETVSEDGESQSTNTESSDVGWADIQDLDHIKHVINKRFKIT